MARAIPSRRRLVGALAAGTVLCLFLAAAAFASWISYGNDHPHWNDHRTLNQGHAGLDVAFIQGFMHDAGYTNEQSCSNGQSWDVFVDGVFGSCTKGNVKEMQFDAGVAMDGILGSLTWERVQKYVYTHDSVGTSTSRDYCKGLLSGAYQYWSPWQNHVSLMNTYVNGLGWPWTLQCAFNQDGVGAVVEFWGTNRSSSGVGWHWYDRDCGQWKSIGEAQDSGQGLIPASYSEAGC